MRLHVAHTTRFIYSSKVVEMYMELRVRPRDDARQRCLAFDLKIEPESRVSSYSDGFQNWVHYLNHLAPHDRVVVTSRSLVETGVPAEDVVDGFPEDFLQFRSPVENVAGVRRFADRLRPAHAESATDVEAALDALALDIHDKFEYQPETTDVYTGVAEVLKLRRGVCQDFAHLYVAVGRAMGIPTRYVSGYIVPGDVRRGAAASHAWAEAWVPGRGWIGYDPTNPVRVGPQHIAVAVGRDYLDVAPTRGVYKGRAGEVMEVEVQITPDGGTAGGLKPGRAPQLPRRGQHR
jgi:transglutaminase-like putative cysteine protease